MPRTLLMLALSPVLLGYASAQPAQVPSRTTESAYGQIRRAVDFIAKSHVVPVDEKELVREALRAIDAEACGAATGGDLDCEPSSFLDDAIAQLRRARPAVDDDRIVAIAVKAMAKSLRDDSSFMEPEALGLGRPEGTSDRSRAGLGLFFTDHKPYPLVSRILPGGLRRPRAWSLASSFGS